ncbi:NAD-dependent epimerase/dehydratase family protein [Aliarcobacter cryaerophilus]|uniref:NAD-dependent epimerase/dehydratase family protein n=1 Tax=Aliarcobacter cryaerophilus TaxID=28198 RepID=UPI003DA62B27
MEEIKNLASINFPWENLNNKHVLISGGSGMIGSSLVELFMHRNRYFNNNIKVTVIARDKNKITKKFTKLLNNDNFNYIIHDINNPLDASCYNYIFHTASNTHPNSYSTDPIGTITTNILGTYNLLNGASSNLNKFIFLSSVEIYGENNSDILKFDEDFSGYINCNTLRAGYPESKRVSESLCQAFISEKSYNISIARVSRIYTPSSQNDSKATSQFIKNARFKQDIVLKSKGEQLYSFISLNDAIEGLLYVFFYGKNSEAYNIANDDNGITLYDFANKLAELSNVSIKFELPNEVEAKGFSVVRNAVMSVEKLKSLGWRQRTTLENGLKKILNDIVEIM